MKRKTFIITMILILAMVPCMAYADTSDAEIQSNSVPAFMSTAPTDDLELADFTISKELVLTSTGNDGLLSGGTITISNLRDTGTINITAVTYTDNASVSGWALAAESDELCNAPINAMKYSLSVDNGTGTYLDFYGLTNHKAAIDSTKVFCGAGDMATLNFKGTLSPSSTTWKKAPIGHAVVTLQLYREAKTYYQLRVDNPLVTVTCEEGGLYQEAGADVIFTVTVPQGYSILSVCTETDDSEKDPINSICEDTQEHIYSFTMPAKPVLITVVTGTN